MLVLWDMWFLILIDLVLVWAGISMPPSQRSILAYCKPYLPFMGYWFLGCATLVISLSFSLELEIKIFSPEKTTGKSR